MAISQIKTVTKQAVCTVCGGVLLYWSDGDVTCQTCKQAALKQQQLRTQYLGKQVTLTPKMLVEKNLE